MTTKFCPECHNMLYKKSEKNKLLEICRHCGYSEPATDNIVSSISYIREINPYDRLTFIHCDKTLPRTNKQICPNEECISNSDESKRESVFMEYGEEKRLMFICLQCKSQWKIA